MCREDRMEKGKYYEEAVGSIGTYDDGCDVYGM